jgi:hypothetical protein
MRWLLLALLAVPAHAHRPGLLDGRLVVPDPTVSWVLAGTFRTGDEVFVAVLDLDGPIATPFELMVPHRAGLRDHRPMLAVVGPGLPEPTAAELTVLPRALPDGFGLYLERNDAPDREVHFEQVMRRTTWTSGTTAVALRAGEHELWVWSPAGTTGDFMVALGVEEDFGGGAIADLFRDWGAYAW